MGIASLTWRALTTGDAPALARAYGLVEAADDTGEHYSEQDIRDQLDDHSVALDRDTRAALGCTVPRRSVMSTASTPRAPWCRPPADAGPAAHC